MHGFSAPCVPLTPVCKTGGTHPIIGSEGASVRAIEGVPRIEENKIIVFYDHNLYFPLRLRDDDCLFSRMHRTIACVLRNDPDRTSLKEKRHAIMERSRPTSRNSKVTVLIISSEKE